MITQENYVDIHVLHKQGLSIRAIARKLKLSRNIVRRHLSRPTELPKYQERAKRPTKLDPYKDCLLGRIDAAKPQWIPAAVLYREIKALGYDGGCSMVRLYVSSLKPKHAEPVVRFETNPGKQLQVDFTTTTIRRGRQTLKAFVAALGYSRASFVRFSDSEKQDDWLTGIEAALAYFGGVPQDILFDNAKCIMIERDAYGAGEHRWNPALLEQAQRLGCRPKACRPYRAQTKGKVERFNRYLKWLLLLFNILSYIVVDLLDASSGLQQNFCKLKKLERSNMPKKQSGNKTSSLAGKILSGNKKATQADVKKLAASVLSRDETKGKRK